MIELACFRKWGSFFLYVEIVIVPWKNFVIFEPCFQRKLIALFLRDLNISQLNLEGKLLLSVSIGLIAKSSTFCAFYLTLRSMTECQPMGDQSLNVEKLFILICLKFYL